MALTQNWNGEPVAVRRSRGGVLTFERWEDNVLGTPPWPTALVAQVRGYVAPRSHFADADAEALAAHLDGRISKFQSVNSEDAVTYSWVRHTRCRIRRYASGSGAVALRPSRLLGYC